ncbi:MAG TPA: phosphohydrolase, partial [Bacteroidales bacterium]|nr:phosphohydrolase [Bacteroidales bacterium]
IHSLKLWSQHSDIVLSYLAGAIINRRLLKVQLQKESFDTEQVERLRKIASEKMNISASEAQQLVFTDVVSNNAYSYADDQIHILIHGNTIDIARASDMLNHQVLSKTVTKNILCYPKEISGFV